MEMGFESFAGRLGKRAASPAGQSCDWQGLHLRLATAHAARRAMLVEFGAQASAGGSFDPAAAQALGALEEHLVAINLTDLADGKSDAGRGKGVAAAQARGGQG